MDKLCTSCNRTLPATSDYFWRKTTAKDGLQVHCIECCKAKAAATKDRKRELSHRWYEAHRAEHLARTRQWQLDHAEQERERRRCSRAEKPEMYRANGRRYRRRHAALQVARNRAYRTAHPEVLRAYSRVRYRADSLPWREWAARRHARVLGLVAEPVDYHAILARDGYICHICGDMVAPDDLSFDHIVPFALGGPHVASNVAVAHWRCNVVTKRAKLVASAIPPAV